MWLCTNCISLDTIVHTPRYLSALRFSKENWPRTAMSRLVPILTEKRNERQNSRGELGTLREHDMQALVRGI